MKIYIAEGGVKCVTEEEVKFIPEGHWMYQELVQPWLDAGNTLQSETPPELTREEIIYATDKAIEAWLDGFVQQRNYKSIESCIGWIDDEDPYFAAEGAAAKRWRSAVYRAARDMLTSPPAGVTPYNVTSYLPQPEEFNWPAQMVGPLSLDQPSLFPAA